MFRVSTSTEQERSLRTTNDERSSCPFLAVMRTFDERIVILGVGTKLLGF